MDSPDRHTHQEPARFSRDIMALFDRFLDWALGRLTLMRAEFELFAGTALLIVGMLGFRSGKYCDGNTADYLSCTRPSTFYYYSTFDIALVVIGFFLVLFWFLSRSRRA